MSDSNAVLDRLVSIAGELYSLPAVAMDVLELTSNPHTDTRALKECIEKDPAMTGKILRVVNSSLFGLSREVSDLNQALALLGVKPLKLLVLGFSLPPKLCDDVESGTLERFWRHTLTRAVVAREISESLWEMPGDDAFIAGLLRDVGILLLIQELGTPYVSLLEEVAANGLDLASLEQEAMGFDHATLSARLLARWCLPDSLIEGVHPGSGVSFGETPLQETHGFGVTDSTMMATTAGTAIATSDLPAIVSLAELLAQLLADGRTEALPRVLEVGKTLHGLTEAELGRLVDSLGRKVSQLADVLSLQLPADTDYRDVLVRAHRQLATVSSGTSEDMLRAQHINNRAITDGLSCLTEALAQASSRPMPREQSRAGGSAEPSSSHETRLGGDRLATGQADAYQAAARRGDGSQGRLEEDATPSEKLTGGDAPTATSDLLDRLSTVVGSARQSRTPLSLLLVEFDRFQELSQAGDVNAAAQLRFALALACDSLEPNTAKMRRGDASFAVFLPGCDRIAASRAANELVEAARHFTIESNGCVSPTVSVGVASIAMLPKNFPAEELLSAADRCLYGALASGGNMVKSIEIY